MSELTMCGYRCYLCKAFSQNIEKTDEREKLSKMWKKYYGVNMLATDIYCDGCRCDKPDAKRIDIECPVRNCAIKKGVLHCGECNEYPCETFNQRKGLTFDEAKQQQGEEFNSSEYNDFLLAYDNQNTLSQYINTKKNKQKDSRK